VNKNKENIILESWSEWIIKDYDKNKNKSCEYYEETGKLDGFARAEIELLEYEEYEKQFEIISEEDNKEVEYIDDIYDDLEDSN
jgi:antirestriction protein